MDTKLTLTVATFLAVFKTIEGGSCQNGFTEENGSSSTTNQTVPCLPKCCPEDQILSSLKQNKKHGYECISYQNTKPDFKSLPILKYLEDEPYERRDLKRPFFHPNSSCKDECGLPRCEGLDGSWTYGRLEERNWQAVVVYEENKHLLVLKINETSVRPQKTMIRNYQ